MLNGIVTDFSQPNITINYGINTFFVPEGSGAELENKDIRVEVIVGRNGISVVNRLLVDGKPFNIESVRSRSIGAEPEAPFWFLRLLDF